MIIESCILLATLVTPQDFGLPPPYPAGTLDDGDFSPYDPPAAIYPLLRLPSPVKLSKGVTIPSGTYYIKPTDDEKYLILSYGHGDVYLLPVYENTIIDDYKEKPVSTIKIEPDRIIITYQREHIFKKVILPVTKDY